MNFLGLRSLIITYKLTLTLIHFAFQRSSVTWPEALLINKKKLSSWVQRWRHRSIDVNSNEVFMTMRYLLLQVLQEIAARTSCAALRFTRKRAACTNLAQLCDASRAPTQGSIQLI